MARVLSSFVLAVLAATGCSGPSHDGHGSTFAAAATKKFDSAAIYQSAFQSTGAATTAAAAQVSKMKPAAYYDFLATKLTDDPISIDGVVVRNFKSGFVASLPRLKSLSAIYPTMGDLWATGANTPPPSPRRFKNLLKYIMQWQNSPTPDASLLNASYGLSDASKQCTFAAELAGAATVVAGAGCAIAAFIPGVDAVTIPTCAAGFTMAGGSATMVGTACAAKTTQDTAEAAKKTAEENKQTLQEILANTQPAAQPPAPTPAPTPAPSRGDMERCAIPGRC